MILIDCRICSGPITWPHEQIPESAVHRVCYESNIQFIIAIAGRPKPRTDKLIDRVIYCVHPTTAA